MGREERRETELKESTDLKKEKFSLEVIGARVQKISFYFKKKEDRDAVLEEIKTIFELNQKSEVFITKWT